jgi:aromatic ring hydroxylase
MMNKILALFLDRFKAASPRVWALIVFILVVVKYTVEQGNIYGFIPIDGQMQQVADWLTYVIALLIGSRTTAILTEGIVTPQMQIADVLTADLSEITAKHSDLLDNFSVLSDTNIALQKELEDKTARVRELEDMPAPQHFLPIAPLETTNTPSKHGGYRAGAGRKPKK